MSNSKTGIPAIILAGAPAQAELQERFGVAQRAAVPMVGKPMVQHVVDALRKSEYVTDIYIVGDIQCEGVVRSIPPEGSLLENLLSGLRACGAASGGHVLVSTCDIPMVTSDGINDLVGKCTDTSIDFYYSIIPKKANEKRFPGMRRTYVRLAEGTFTGGNIMIMKSGFVIENADLITEIFSARKSPLKLASLIGFGTLFRAVIAQRIWAGAVNIPVLESAVGRLINGKVKAVSTDFPEIGADADDVDQIETMERMMQTV